MADEQGYTEIPEIFHSFHNEGPFTRCIECDRNLLEDDCEYVIEKAIRNYPDYQTSDTIFDYAICMDCAEKIHQELSKESTQNIQKFFSERLDIGRRSQRIEQANGNVGQLIANCMITDEPKNTSREYQVFAHCKGNRINMSNPPYMLSGEVLAELAELLSEKTRDDLNGFFNKHFSPDPSLMEPTPRLVLI